MTKTWIALGALAAAAACGTEKPNDDNNQGPLTTLGADGATTNQTPTSGSDGGVDNAPDADGPDDDASGDGPSTLFDIGGMGDTACQGEPAGIVCDDTTSVLCDGNGNAEDTTNCLPGLCVAGEGCVTCIDGQFNCQGPNVMACNTAGAEPTWQVSEVCDPAANMACDAAMGTCVALTPIGGIEPTGVYYQYALFDVSSNGYSQVSDVDTYQNHIYFVAMKNNTLTVGQYDVTLHDTDGDGMFEPNQHPDNPDETGPVEERTFEFVQDLIIPNPGAFPNVMELYATADKLYYTALTGIYEWDFATATSSQVAVSPAWLPETGYSSVSFLGYDPINDVWYSGNELARRVFQYDSNTSAWGWSFEFPPLAGDHMDGIEVVVDQSTQTPYLYVSDMTSNFIGQYRNDPMQGWVQENLFSYNETTGALVEGFGFGALGHFWVGSLANVFYELGGGDLTDYLEPEG